MWNLNFRNVNVIDHYHEMIFPIVYHFCRTTSISLFLVLLSWKSWDFHVRSQKMRIYLKPR